MSQSWTVGLQTTQLGDPHGTGIRLVAMGNIFEELCISNAFCSVEFIMVTILLGETLKMLDCPHQSKQGDVSKSISSEGKDQCSSLFSVALLL